MDLSGNKEATASLCLDIATHAPASTYGNVRRCLRCRAEL